MSNSTKDRNKENRLKENRLKEYRLKYNLTQEDLARQTGVTLATINNIENNRTIPSVKIAIKIMRVFKEKDIEKLFII